MENAGKNAGSTMKLNPELVQMIKQQSDEDYVVEEKFDDLYGDVETNVQHSMSVAMDCYMVHHRRPDYESSAYRAGIEYNPLLTLVWDEIGAVSRKYQVAPLNGVTATEDGVTFMDCVLVEDEGAEVTTDEDAEVTTNEEDAEVTTNAKKTQQQRQHVLSSVAKFFFATEFAHMLFVPSYGIFQDGELDMSEKTAVVDVICQHDAADVVRLLLKDGLVEGLGMVLAMLDVAKKFHAFACYKELYDFQFFEYDPMLIIYQLVCQSSAICTPIAFNAFYVLDDIQQRFAGATRFVENFTDRFQDLQLQLGLAKQRFQGSVVEPFQNEDLQLFAQSTVLLLEILLAAVQSGCKQDCDDREDIEVILISSVLAYKILDQFELLISVDESKVQFVLASYNKIAKLLFQLNPEIALNILHKFSFMGAHRPRLRKAAPKSLMLYTEFLMLCIRYGYHDTRLVSHIVDESFACDCDGGTLHAIQLHAQLLPRTSLQVYRDGKERWRTFVDDCVEEGNVKKTAEALARNDKVLQRIDAIYERNTVPSLQVLCRSKLYNMLPAAKLQALVDDVEIPKPVREFLALDTLSLEYDAIKFLKHLKPQSDKQQKDIISKES